MSDRVTFVIPSRLWLTSNRPAQNMAARARLVRELHELAHFMAIFHKLDPTTGPVAAHWTIRYLRVSGSTRETRATRSQRPRRFSMGWCLAGYPMTAPRTWWPRPSGAGRTSTAHPTTKSRSC